MRTNSGLTRGLRLTGIVAVVATMLMAMAAVSYAQNGPGGPSGPQCGPPGGGGPGGAPPPGGQQPPGPASIANEQEPPVDQPTPPGGDDPIGDPDKQCGVPHGGFDRGFFNQVHKMVAEDVDIVSIDGRQYIAATVTKMPTPPRFDDQVKDIVDQLAYFKFRMSQIDDRHGDSVSRGELKQADKMNLRGKFIRPDKWVSEDGDNPSPTFNLRGGDIVG